jgi:hypothetical protein
MAFSFTLEVDDRDQFRDDPLYAHDFYAAIGRTIVAWGKLERALDLTAHSARTIESEHPITGEPDMGLKRKIKAVRRALRSHPPHQNNQKFITRLLAAITSTANRRNMIVHGMFIGFSKTKKPRIQFSSRRYSPKGHKKQKLPSH